MKKSSALVREHIGITAPLAQVVTLSVAVGAYSLLALLKSRPPLVYVPDIPVGLDAALSFAIALLMSFRINRAYERWWEARTLWGTLVNVSRNLAIKVRQLRQPSQQERQAMRDLIVAFSMGLKDHLRSDAQLNDLPGFEDSTAEPRHIPSHIAGKIYHSLEQWKTPDDANGTLELLVYDSEARVFMDVCGGCERIKKTPVSTSWRAFALQCIVIYLVVLPWGLVDDFGIWTAPIAMLIAYFIVAAEAISRYVEEPFGLQEDHLDLDSITDAIDESVSEILLTED